LYSIFIDDLICALEDVPEDKKVKVNGYSLSPLFFADDIVLATHGPTRYKRMEHLLKICEKHSMLNNYRFNASKSKALSSSKYEYTLYNERIGKVETFKYLGIIFDKSGINWDLHVATKIQKATRMALSFKSSVVNNIGIRARVSIYRTFIRPIVEYGLLLFDYKNP
jgi:hypothetical protein